jgi:hypothetical protein
MRHSSKQYTDKKTFQPDKPRREKTHAFDHRQTEAERIAARLLGEPKTKGPRKPKPPTIRHFSWETENDRD